MNVENRVRDNMMLLQEVFKRTRAFVEKKHNTPSILEFIDQYSDSKFISIAYEAAAMGLALKDLEKSNKLDLWQDFFNNHGQLHAVQVHVGLGWACGQKRLDPKIWINDLEPLLAWRIWDGYGYYDGFFRKRKVLQGVLPEKISKKALSPYWQGVGRSFWYTSKGNYDKLEKIVANILPLYQADFWRGIGIASTYVGGQTLTEVQDLWQFVGRYQAQLAAGAALAIQSKAAANTLTKESEIIANEWCKLPILKIVDLVKNNAMHSVVANAALYNAWIKSIDEAFNC